MIPDSIILALAVIFTMAAFRIWGNTKTTTEEDEI